MGSIHTLLIRVESKRLKEFKNGMDESISKFKSDVPVTMLMDANVDAESDAFNLVRKTSEKQAVSDRDYTEWSWDVRPKKPGTFKINVRLTAHLSISNTDVPIECF